MLTIGVDELKLVPYRRGARCCERIVRFTSTEPDEQLACSTSIANPSGTLYLGAMASEIQTIIHTVVERAPQWLRQDLSSQDPATRSRAEETIAAMIAEALGKVSVR